MDFDLFPPPHANDPELVHEGLTNSTSAGDRRAIATAPQEPQTFADNYRLEYLITPRLLLLDPYRVPLLQALERSKISTDVSFSDSEARPLRGLALSTK